MDITIPSSDARLGTNCLYLEFCMALLMGHFCLQILTIDFTGKEDINIDRELHCLDNLVFLNGLIACKFLCIRGQEPCQQNQVPCTAIIAITVEPCWQVAKLTGFPKNEIEL